MATNRLGRMKASSLTRGAFTLSLDFELIWGTLDTAGPDGFARQCMVEREQVIDQLLSLLGELDISATWCVLGHLMLESCSCVDGVKHPEIVRPNHAWHTDDWFTHDPAGSEATDPNFYGASLVEKIRECPVPQEIGCHSFSHPIFGDSGCSRETADSELAACRRLAAAQGIEMHSFAFPRNSPGHLDVLAQHGFTCFRGPEPNWYERPRLPREAKRAAHFADVVLARSPPVVVPFRAGELWNVPGSMIYLPMHGIRRLIPVQRRVTRALKGLDRAVLEKRLFHLWLHPTNLADRLPQMLSGLRTVLGRASHLRERGQLSIVPMAGVPELLADRSA
jgi:peptidoglycan/xylan/chitin deacetylase (PgdA/CDA1 family)